jgi:hypothetical protein
VSDAKASHSSASPTTCPFTSIVNFEEKEIATSEGDKEEPMGFIIKSDQSE